MVDSAHPYFRILSLAGGGYLGLYTATVLAGLERRAGRPLAQCFDLIAGTSVGGLLGLALAFEVPVIRIVELFRERGSEIFSARSLPTSNVGRLLDLTRSVLGPKYSGESLRAALTEIFDKRRLGDAPHRLVVPAVNVSLSQTKVFKTPHGERSTGDERVLAVDVAMATSAAPAYFPSVKVGRYLYADGGIFAVAPDQVALHEAEHFLGIAPPQIRMLSIGTATSGYRPADGVDADDGAVGWLSDGRLILTTVAVQQQHVESMLEDRLGARYQRIDAEWPAGAGLGIDIATPAAADTLVALAERTLGQLNQAEFDQALGN
ncbi:MAG: CBASS cGAMP-activated phospholipase [Lysobacterales bacterium]|nr:patatin-like phospholipase family protein [Xanthomonadales bacterium]MCP5476479.1 patatin-like phospholipase family protein [Rhodanobacteraceae bacterium]